ncbi:MAG: hypothetical protein R6U64_09070 [Bacteroidales bacterium]
MKKVASIFLSLMLLGMSLQPALALHYCQGELARVKLVAGYGKASCGMMPERHQDHSHDIPQSLNAASCCLDDLQKAQTDDFTSSVLPILNLNPVASPVHVPMSMGVPTSFFSSLRVYYPPPSGVSSVSLPVIGVFIV